MKFHSILPSARQVVLDYASTNSTRATWQRFQFHFRRLRFSWNLSYFFAFWSYFVLFAKHFSRFDICWRDFQYLLKFHFRRLRFSWNLSYFFAFWSYFVLFAKHFSRFDICWRDFQYLLKFACNFVTRVSFFFPVITHVAEFEGNFDFCF